METVARGCVTTATGMGLCASGPAWAMVAAVVGVTAGVVAVANAK